MRSWLVVVGLVVAGLVVVGLLGACGNPPVAHMGNDAAVDAPDAMPDAVAWSITIDSPQFAADPFTQHAVTVVGAPGADVQILTDRIHAGVITPRELVLDGTGHGSATYIPCASAIPACAGDAMLEAVQGDAPQGMTPIVYATTPITLTAIADIGDTSGCTGSGNVMYMRKTYYPRPLTTYTSPPDAAWSVLTYPDAARFTIDGAQRLELSLQALAEPLAAGTYTNAQLSPPSNPGRPALALFADCDNAGRYQIDELTEDPTYGTLESITVRFEQAGCDDDEFAVGCLHYTATPVTPPSPPLPDPSKLAVSVYLGDGTPDVAAMAILTDATGAVVLDTTVDSFGFAQAPLIGTGELTVIQHLNGEEYARTYRGVHAGDYVVINPPQNTGTLDQMLVTIPSLPPNASLDLFVRPCMSASPANQFGIFADELNFWDPCRTPTFSMLTSISFPGGAPDQFMWQTGLQHVANGNVEVTGTWTPYGTANVTVSNVPANIPTLFLRLSTMVGAGVAQIGGLTVNSPAAGDVPFALSYPIGGGDAMQIDLQIENGVDTPDWITKVLLGSPANVTVDYTANPVPLISAVQQSATGASWTETGSGSVDVRTVFWRGFANNQRMNWTIIEPYDGHPSTRLPALPPGHASDDPATDPAVELHGAAALYRDYDVSAGFTLTPPAPPYETRQTGAQTYDMSFPF